jgi:hypothetical protein
MSDETAKPGAGEAREVGWVAWPKDGDGWKNTHEGGMWVYAFWLTQEENEPWAHCSGPAGTLLLPLPDVCVGTWPERKDPFYEPVDWSGGTTEARSRASVDAGPAVLGALCLGTTDASWLSDTEGYFICSPGDLTAECMALLGMTSRMLGRPVVLVTYLDT